MKIIYELSWLWETLGIALMAAVVCVVGAMLICRAKKKKLSKKSTVVIGIAAFIIAIVAVIEIVLAPGGISHSGPGENRQFWPDENSQS